MLAPYFANPVLLLAAVVLPALAALALWARYRRQTLMSRLGPAAVMAGQVNWPVGRWRATVGWTLGILLIVIGIATPHWGLGPPPPTAPGRDIVCVVDVSRSMLAQDALPSRLGRAKESLLEVADAAQARGGHRLALVAFAGRAAVTCPLTHDYNHFRAKVTALSADPPPADVRASGPAAVSGTRIGAGIQRAVELLDPQFRGAQEIIVLSDGDDPAGDEEWRNGIAATREAGVSVNMVGVGDPSADSPIPLETSRLTFHGAEVRTRLHEQPLREIAAKCGGDYVAVRTGPPRLNELFRTRLAAGPTRETVTGTLPQPIVRHSFFFAAALTFIVGIMIHVRARAAGRFIKRTARSFAMSARHPATAVVALVLVSATPPADWLRRGNEALDRGRIEDALTDFSLAAQTTTDPGLAAFNEGVALFRLSRFRESELAFRRCLSDAKGGRRVRALYNLGCCLTEESHGRITGSLASAVASFAEGLKELHDGDPLGDDLRHNLGLTKRLLAAARHAHTNESPEPPDQTPPVSAGRDEGSERPGRESAPMATGLDGRPMAKNDGRMPNPTDKQARPGKGKLPPLPDEDALTPMTPDDAQAHLDKAARRIAAERRAALKRTTPAPATAIPDW
jgi:Ca-activated chloride channel family protein